MKKILIILLSLFLVLCGSLFIYKNIDKTNSEKRDDLTVKESYSDLDEFTSEYDLLNLIVKSNSFGSVYKSNGNKGKDLANKYMLSNLLDILKIDNIDNNIFNVNDLNILAKEIYNTNVTAESFINSEQICNLNDKKITCNNIISVDKINTETKEIIKIENISKNSYQALMYVSYAFIVDNYNGTYSVYNSYDKAKLLGTVSTNNMTIDDLLNNNIKASSYVNTFKISDNKYTYDNTILLEN